MAPASLATTCRSSGSNFTNDPGARLERLAAGLDPHAAVDDDEEGVLLHLMVAELLARVEADQDGTRLALRNGGRQASGFRPGVSISGSRQLRTRRSYPARRAAEGAVRLGP